MAGRLIKQAQMGSSRGQRAYRHFRKQTGVELVEFAFMFAMLLTLLLGIFWFGRAYNIYTTITQAARLGARLAVSRSCASCGNAIASDSAIQQAVFNSLKASSIDTSKITSSCPPSLPTGASCESGYCAGGSICIIRDYPLNNTNNAPKELGVVISFGYPVPLPIPFVTISSVTVTTQVQMREEN